MIFLSIFYIPIFQSSIDQDKYASGCSKFPCSHGHIPRARMYSLIQKRKIEKIREAYRLRLLCHQDLLLHLLKLDRLLQRRRQGALHKRRCWVVLLGAHRIVSHVLKRKNIVEYRTYNQRTNMERARVSYRLHVDLNMSLWAVFCDCECFLNTFLKFTFLSLPPPNFASFKTLFCYFSLLNLRIKMQISSEVQALKIYF